MTIRLYYQGITDAISVQVTSVSECELGCIVTLDKTVFHPQGGGQPSDLGKIGNSNVSLVKEVENRIEHHLDDIIPLGATFLQVDDKKRKLHSQLHSLGHLIGHAGELQGLRPVKAHHWPGECKVEFILGDSGFCEAELKSSVMHWIEQNLMMQQVIDEQGKRLVSFGSMASYPCGGTHVTSTGEIDTDILFYSKMKKNKVSVKYYLET